MAHLQMTDVPGHILVKGYCPDLEIRVKKKAPAEISKGILKALKIEELNTLQNNILCGVSSGSDLIVTGPNGVGKTLGYLTSTLTYMSEWVNEEKGQQLQASPLALICCSTSEKAVYLETILQKIDFLKGPSGSCRVAILDNVRKLADASFPDNDPLIIIMTASFLQCALPFKARQILNEANIDYSRLKFIIFDELGMRFYFYSSEIVDLLFFLEQSKNVHRDQYQIIFSGSMWSWELSTIYEKMVSEAEMGPNSKKTLLLFACPLQALLYARARWEVKHCFLNQRNGYKMEWLVGRLNELLNENRTIVIACSSDETSQSVSQFLADAGISNTLTARDRNGMGQGIFQQYTGSVEMVHVVADHKLKYMAVRNASAIVHFDIDSNVNSEAVDGEPLHLMRFACMWDKLGRTLEPRPIVIMIATGFEDNFHLLYRFARSIKIPIPVPLKELGRQQLKEVYKNVPLCDVIKCFGFCSKTDCTQRHEFTESDLKSKADCPAEGEIEFKVITCQNPSLYLVRLMEHYVHDENGEKKCVKVYKDEIIERMNVLREYYKVAENRFYPFKVEPGEMYAVECSSRSAPVFGPNEKLYLRGRISEVLHVDNDSKSVSFVEVFYVDTGSTIRIRTNRLLELPDVFKRWQAHCVNLILTNLLSPFDTSLEYYSDDLKGAKQLSEGKVWYGAILLSLGNNVWVNPMISLEKNPITGYIERGLNLRTELVASNHASVFCHHRHMEVILSNIRKCDPTYPEIIHEGNSGSLDGPGSFFKREDPIEWLTMDLIGDSEEIITNPSPVLMKIHSFIDPWKVYVAPVDQAQNGGVAVAGALKQIELGIAYDVEKNLIPTFRSKMDMDLIRHHILEMGPGMMVAVKGEQADGSCEWHRGYVLGLAKMEDICRRFDVFLVDYGITKLGMAEVHQVLPLKRRYVEALPFQAVCLKLAHIQPVQGKKGGWKKDQIAHFSGLLTNEGACVNVIAHASVQGSDPICNYYKAFALQLQSSQESPEQSCIGLRMVQQNYAGITPKYQSIISKLEKSLAFTMPAWKDSNMKFDMNVYDGDKTSSDERDSNNDDGDRDDENNVDDAEFDDDDWENEAIRTFKILENSADSGTAGLFQMWDDSEDEKEAGLCKAFCDSDSDEIEMPGPPIPKVPLAAADTKADTKCKLRQESSDISLNEISGNEAGKVKKYKTVTTTSESSDEEEIFYDAVDWDGIKDENN